MSMLVLANLQLWVTPIWLLAVGLTVGFAIVLAFWGVLSLANRRLGQNLYHQVCDGVLLPVTYVLIAFAAIAALASPSMPVSDAWDAVTRIWSVGESGEIAATIPPRTEDHVVDISFRADELISYSFQTDQDLRISAEPGVNLATPTLLVDGGPEAYEWSPKSKLRRSFQGTVDQLYVSNISDAPANLVAQISTDVAMPEVHHLPVMAGSVVGLFALYLLLQNLLPGIGTIAVGTSKEAMGQPLFLLLIVVGVVGVIIFNYIPYNTFGEDVKMLKDSGLTWIMVLAVVFALWTSSTSIAEEIDGKTALTLLSKPISRRQFILGKFAGITWPLVLMFVVLGVVLLAVVSYKVVYDARETSNPTPDWQYCYSTMIGTVPGLVLMFLETLVLTSISVAISTKLSMVPNLIICGSIYVVGNLLPQLVNAAVADPLPFVGFVGQFIAGALPMLHVFNIAPAIAGGKDVPYEYLGFALLYAMIYCTAAMLLALALFEDRDLA